MKTTWTWIVVGIVVLVLLTMTLREGFEATDKIKDPSTWNAEEIARIRKLVDPESTLAEADIRTVVGGFWSKWKEATSQITTNDVNSYLNTQPAAAQSRQAYFGLIKAYYIDQGQSVFQQARQYVASYTDTSVAQQNPTDVTTPSVDQPPPSQPSIKNLPRPTMGSEKLRQDIAVYAGVPKSNTAVANVYVTQAQKFYDTVYSVDKKQPTDAQLYGFVEAVDMSTIPETMRANFSSALVSILDSYFSPTASSDTTATEQDEIPGQPIDGSSAGSADVPGSAGTGASTATTTGGDSGVTYGPTSAPKGGRNVWGPLFKGIGQGAGPEGGDSTKSNAYPALLGGMGGRSGTMLESVGVVAPSGFGLEEVMPSETALGSGANARFLPYSRQPGDMDIVPDPYRLAKNFSSSSYSASKTDPVPFLTDFSAFYR